MKSSSIGNAKMAPCRLISACQPRPVTTASHAKSQPSSHAPVRDSLLEVYAISDLHTDYPDNMRWVEGLAAVHLRRARQAHAAASSERPPGSFIRSLSAVGSVAAPAACEGGTDAEAKALHAATAEEEVLQVQRVLIVAGDVSDCMSTLR